MSVEWRKRLSFTQDKDAYLDYTMDFTDWLNGDTISSHEISVDSGLTCDLSTNTDTTVTAWVSGGEVNTIYDLSFKITTTNVPARIDERTIRIKITEK